MNKILWALGIVFSTAVMFVSAEFQPITFGGGFAYHAEAMRQVIGFTIVFAQAGGNMLDNFAVKQAQIAWLGRHA